MAHPFPYVGSGIAAARKTMSCWACFDPPVPVSVRAQLVAGIPAPLAESIAWDGRVLQFGHDSDSLQWVVRAHYAHVVDPDDDHEADPELPSDAMWKAFNAELDAWLLRVHAQHPVALFVKPIDEEYQTEVDDWHAWSCEQIPTRALPLVTGLGKDRAWLAQYLAQLWHGWAEEQPLARQHELLAALPVESRELLDEHDALFTPTAAPVAPRTPNVDEAVALWRELAAAGGPLRLEDAFELEVRARGFAPDGLSQHIHELCTVKRHDDLIELCRAVIASGAEFPTNWYPTLAYALIEEGRLDEAEPVIRALIGELESYKPEMLSTAMRYHRARGERELEALLYHFGIAHFSSFSGEHTRAEVATYGKRPAALLQQVMAWFEHWIGASHWTVATQSRLGHWLGWFDKLGVDAVGPRLAEFTAERDRRGTLYEQLMAAPDEAAARTLVEQLAPTARTDIAVRTFHALHPRAPLGAFDLLRRAIANERRTGFRHKTGEQVSAVVSLTFLALTQPALAETLAEVYEVARGYMGVDNAELHFNLACVAARLDRRDDALRAVARSLALDWPEPEQIRRDNDLVVLHGDAAFEALFVADAARRAVVADAAAAEAAAKLAKEQRRAERAAAKAAKASAPKAAKASKPKAAKASKPKAPAKPRVKKPKP